MHQPSPSTVRAVRFYVMFLLLWQSLCRVSDSGMNILFLFLAMFLSLVLAAVPSNKIQNFVNLLPRTVSAAKRVIGQGSDMFRKYVSCHSLYSMDLCKVTLPDKSITSRKCSYVKFPHHPHRIQRSPCDVMLMKTVRTSSGTTSLYPRQIFCYQSIIQSLRVIEGCGVSKSYGKTFQTSGACMICLMTGEPTHFPSSRDITRYTNQSSPQLSITHSTH